MLTANKILTEIGNNNIEIEPFNIKQMNPNSYNCRLGDTLKIYNLGKGGYLDSKCKNDYTTIKIPDDGLIIRPGILYIGNMIERVKTDKYISSIAGRSSVARLGISIHATAGFGDLGFNGQYTLEIFCIHPVKISKDMLIGQLYFEEPDGDINFLYNGRYQNQTDPEVSRLYMNEDELGDKYHMCDDDTYTNKENWMRG